MGSFPPRSAVLCCFVGLLLAPLDYRPSLPPIRRGRLRCDRLGGERGIEQVANRPNAVRNAKRHGWRAAEALMHAAEIVVHDVERHGSAVMVDALAEPVAEARKPLGAHADREVRPLDIGRADLHVGIAVYY